jgi:hypothetical protein
LKLKPRLPPTLFFSFLFFFIPPCVYKVHKFLDTYTIHSFKRQLIEFEGG